MTDQQQHPAIAPPPELRKQWREQAPRYRDGGVGREEWLIDRASQWGYEQRGEVNEAQLQKARDQELEACCELLELSYDWDVSACEYLRVERRPSTSLKQQALKTLEDAPGPDYPRSMTVLTADQHALIRRALEDLPE